jgi:hypothetical protein
MNGGVINGNLQTMNATVRLDAGKTGFNVAFRVFSGTTTAQRRINPSLTIQSTAAALQVSTGKTLTVEGSTTMNGPLSGAGTFRANGTSVTNSALGSVASFQLGGATQSLSRAADFSDNSDNAVTILGGSSTTIAANKQMSNIAINAGDLI